VIDDRPESSRVEKSSARTDADRKPRNENRYGVPEDRAIASEKTESGVSSHELGIGRIKAGLNRRRGIAVYRPGRNDAGRSVKS
jgi:hypothetical protein